MARVGSYVRCIVRPIIQNKIYIFLEICVETFIFS